MMMFGFRKKNAAVDDAEKYCRTMFAGLDQLHGRPVPNQAFGDAYVFGFLQQLIMHATTIIHGKVQDPVTMAATTAATIDRIVPGYGIQLVKAAAGSAAPDHPMNTNYQVGRRDGGEYVRALMTEDQVTQHEMMKSFRDFVVRNYMST